MKSNTENLPTWAKNFDFLNEIEKAAERNEIEKELLLAIVMTESKGLANSVRYEHFYKWTYKLEDITRLYNKHGFFITIDTMNVLQKTSFGLMQVMGAVFFEYDYHIKTDYTLLPIDMIRPEVSLEVGCFHLKKLIDHYKLFRAQDIYAAYNAGSVRLLNGRYANQKNVDNFQRYYTDILSLKD